MRDHVGEELRCPDSPEATYQSNLDPALLTRVLGDAPPTDEQLDDLIEIMQGWEKSGKPVFLRAMGGGLSTVVALLQELRDRRKA